MSQKHPEFHSGKRGAAIAVRVIPRSSNNKICEILSDGSIRIKIKSPPVDGKANDTLIKFLSDAFKIPKTRIEITGGLFSKNKIVTFYDMNPEELQGIIRNILDE